MKCLSFFIFLHSFSAFSSVCLVTNCLKDVVVHYTESLNNEDSASPILIKTQIPKTLEYALYDMSQSPIGQKIYDSAVSLGLSFTFVEVTKETDPDYAVAYRVGYDDLGENAIHYTQDLEGWKNKVTEGKAEKLGEEISSATLGSILTHELGHTEIGLNAIGRKSLFIISFADVVRSERMAVQYFENEYRKYRKLPLRKTYFNIGDMIDDYKMIMNHFSGRAIFQPYLPYRSL